jgi:hypothetical protein
MSIWHTQLVHDAATGALAGMAGAHAFVDVSIHGEGTTGALMIRDGKRWRIERLYTPMDGEAFGVADGAVVVGTW